MHDIGQLWRYPSIRSGFKPGHQGFYKEVNSLSAEPSMQLEQRKQPSVEQSALRKRDEKATKKQQLLSPVRKADRESLDDSYRLPEQESLDEDSPDETSLIGTTKTKAGY